MGEQALDGVKVADFTWSAIGPVVTRYLAVHGATVVRVESATAVDISRVMPPYKDDVVGLNRSAYFAVLNCSKYSMALNLNHPRAREVARRLVAWADVVAENFAPGVIARWGLAYADLRRIKEDIIMVSLSMQGQAGPTARHPGLGSQLVGLSGFCHFTGYPDGGPLMPFGTYTDYIGARFGAAAIVAALDYRRRTGKGQYIDLSQYECGIQFLGPAPFEYSANRKVAGRMGNRHPCAAPHGAYPCYGDDRWCAIGVFTDDDWAAFCKVLGNPEWTRHPKFSTFLSRKQHEEELDGLVAEWTRNFPPEQLMTSLQKAGIGGGVVQTPEDLYSDPQLRHRQQFEQLEHKEIGKHSYDHPSFKLSHTPCEIRMPGPILGEHTEYVCTQILGMSDGEFISLLGEGVFE